MGRLPWRFEILKAGLYASVGAAVAVHFTGITHNEERGFFSTVKAAEIAIPQTVPPYTAPGFVPPKPVNSVGLPTAGHLRVFDGYVCAYDRRNRIPLWVMEHLTPSKLVSQDANQTPVDRAQFDFYEDLGEMEMFRSTNTDYKGSGYDRGHLAAAGNHRLEHSAMRQTFILSNIAPQVGVGFNRHAWNDLEKYVRAIARRANNVVVVTGPLFLPKEEQGKKRVTYEVIGPNNVAVPTHFFKAVAVQENENGPWRALAWVLPNTKLPEKVNLQQFQVPLAAVERSAGLKIFPNLRN